MTRSTARTTPNLRVTALALAWWRVNEAQKRKNTAVETRFKHKDLHKGRFCEASVDQALHRNCE